MGLSFRFSSAGFFSDLQITSQFPSAKCRHFASPEHLHGNFPDPHPSLGWVPFSPLGSHVSLCHSTYLVFFVFSSLSPIHIPFPNWETLEKRNLYLKHLHILRTQRRSRHIGDKQANSSFNLEQLYKQNLS